MILKWNHPHLFLNLYELFSAEHTTYYFEEQSALDSTDFQNMDK